MNNYCVKCIFYEDKQWKETEISVDMKVYPCCVLHYFHFMDKTFYDEYLDNLPENWNSLEHNSMKNILEIYRNYITPEKWESEKTCPPCCLNSCRKE